jgi:OOP family OmpA-OmpF porin
MKLFYFILFYLILFNIKSQNLVLNYSFEDTISCPNNEGQIDSSFYWHNPTNNSPDYFHQCSSNQIISTPINGAGFQAPFTGIAYSGIALIYGSLNGREYITGTLNSTLDSNVVYSIQLNISLSEKSKLAVNKVGLYFHSYIIDTLISGGMNLPYLPHIEFINQNYYSSKTEWMKLTSIYTAKGFEKYFTIGNFDDDVNTSFINTNNYPIDSNNYYRAYYYIDDVYVGEYIEPVFEENKLDISPNPVSNFLVVTYKLKENDAWLEIYNAIGQLVKREFLSGNNGNLNISVVNLSNGMYFGSIVQNEKRLVTKKLMIIK